MKDTLEATESRRRFLVTSGMLIAAAGLTASGCWSGPETETKTIPPTEDLMREHGVMRRLMLVYDEMVRRLKQGEEFPVHVLTDANTIIRRFMQDHHEKNEQLHVFNRFSTAGKMVELVAILSQQHQAGRKLLDKIKIISTEDTLQNPSERARMAESLTTFNQLYRHHAAWEDTVIFPACRAVISPQDLAAVGETFKKEEIRLFGREGYKKMLGQVADLEKILGIHELQQFTPKL
jgi:hemerythrin-like domain-containing protein